jgi:WD40 repeat protein
MPHTAAALPYCRPIRRGVRLLAALALGLSLVGAGVAADSPPRTDLYGDPLPDGAVARVGSVRFQHGGGAWHIVFSPDGKLVATTSPDGTARLLDVATGKEVRHFATDALWLRGTAFTPDGKTLILSGGEKGIGLWDVASGKLVRHLAVPDFVQALALSPDGRTLAASCSDVLHFWDLTTGTELRRVKRSDAWGGWALVFSPDGKTVAATSSDTKSTRLYDVTTGREVGRVAVEAQDGALAYSPRGRLVAVGTRGGDVSLWDVTEGKERRRLKGHKNAVGSVAFSPDGRLLASASGFEPIRLWDPDKGEELRRLQTRPDGLKWLAFSPDGKTLAGVGYRVYLWDLATGKETPASASVPQGHLAAQFLPDGRTLISWGGWYGGNGEGNVIRFLDGLTGREIRKLGLDKLVLSLALSADARTLAVRVFDPAKVHETAISVRDAATGKELWRVPGQSWGALFLPGGRLLTGEYARPELHVWRAATGEEVGMLTRSEARNGIYHLAASPDGSVVASQDAGGGAIVLSDLATGKEFRAVSVASRWASFTFSPDGRVLAVNGGLPREGWVEWDEVRLLDVATGKEARILGRQRLPFGALAFSPDGRTLATGDRNGLVVLWEVATGHARRRLAGHRSGVQSLSFTPDGRLLASGSADLTALVWDLSGRADGARPGPRELEAFWSDLAAQDAARAYRAVLALSATPQAATFLAARLRPGPLAEPRRLAALLADLGSDDFETREAATVALSRLSGRAEEALRKALAGSATPEARRRIGELLDGLDPEKSPAALRRLRAIEALEKLGTSEAREVLRSLARDGDTAWLRHEAAASARRQGR